MMSRTYRDTRRAKYRQFVDRWFPHDGLDTYRQNYPRDLLVEQGELFDRRVFNRLQSLLPLSRPTCWDGASVWISANRASKQNAGSNRNAGARIGATKTDNADNTSNS